nr:hypothetical protein [Bradyrhizobium amphicarpaeae]
MSIESKTMVALFTVLAGFAAIWLGFTYMRVFNAAREHLPPQFQDYEIARYALDVWALQPPMPLTVQADYVRLVRGYPYLALAGALACLSSGRADAMVFGVLLLAVFAYSVFYAIKCSRVYEQNCKRAEAQSDEENQ